MPWWLANVSREDATTTRVCSAGFEPALFLREVGPVVVRGRLVPKVLRPLWPNYLFVRAGGSTERLLDVRGVHGLVRVEDDRVAEVRDEVVVEKVAESLPSAYRAYRYVVSLSVVPVASKFRAGDVVRVVSEASVWWGHSGSVSMCVGGVVVVDLPLLGRVVQVKLLESDVELCVESAAEPRSSRRRRRKRCRAEASAAAA